MWNRFKYATEAIYATRCMCTPDGSECVKNRHSKVAFKFGNLYMWLTSILWLLIPDHKEINKYKTKLGIEYEILVQEIRFLPLDKAIGLTRDGYIQPKICQPFNHVSDSEQLFLPKLWVQAKNAFTLWPEDLNFPQG